MKKILCRIQTTNARHAGSDWQSFLFAGRLDRKMELRLDLLLRSGIPQAASRDHTRTASWRAIAVDLSYRAGPRARVLWLLYLAWAHLGMNNPKHSSDHDTPERTVTTQRVRSIPSRTVHDKDAVGHGTRVRAKVPTPLLDTIPRTYYVCMYVCVYVCVYVLCMYICRVHTVVYEAWG